MLAVRDGPWKLFVNHDGNGARLFNIPEDPAERGARRRGRDARADRRTAPGREGEERRTGKTPRDGALSREEFVSVGAR